MSKRKAREASPPPTQKPKKTESKTKCPVTTTEGMEPVYIRLDVCPACIQRLQGAPLRLDFEDDLDEQESPLVG